jgi:hypothetical protein
MAQAVSLRPLTADAHFQFRVISHWICDEIKWKWDRFFFEYYHQYITPFHSSITDVM